MHVFTLSPDLHSDFLAAQHQDPAQKRPFRIGDRVVFCQHCATALLEETWLDAGKEHCGQKHTRSFFPAKENLRTVGVDWASLLYPHPKHFEAFVLPPHLRKPLSGRLQARRWQHAQRVLVGLLAFWVFALWSFDGWRSTLWAVGLAGLVLGLVLFVSGRSITFLQKENTNPLAVELYQNGFLDTHAAASSFIPLAEVKRVELQLLPAKKGRKRAKMTIFHAKGVTALPLQTVAYPPLIQALGHWSRHKPVRVVAVCEEVYRFVKYQNTQHGANFQQKNIYA